MRHVAVVALVLLTSSSWAQLADTSNVPTAVANSVVAALQSFKKEGTPSDVLTGLCEFNGSNCNGAEITLFKGQQQVYAATLTGTGKFEIPKLKRNESYQLNLNWPKYKVSETRQVEAGQFISINLSNN